MDSMFSGFLNRLTQPEPAPLADADARLALCALLVRVARSDGTYSPSEAQRIERIMISRYSIDAAAAAELRDQADTLETEAPDTVRFTRAIKEAVAYEDREAVVEALWDVVLIDGSRDYEEDALLRLTVKLLGINDRDSALARQRVEAQKK